MITLICAYLIMGVVLYLLVAFGDITEGIKNKEYSVLSVVARFIIMGFATPVMLVYGIVECMVDYSSAK